MGVHTTETQQEINLKSFYGMLMDGVRENIIKFIDPDVIYIQETHLKGNDVIHFKSYKWFGYNK